jgi:hypothetical protein
VCATFLNASFSERRFESPHKNFVPSFSMTFSEGESDRRTRGESRGTQITGIPPDPARLRPSTFPPRTPIHPISRPSSPPRSRLPRRRRSTSTIIARGRGWPESRLLVLNAELAGTNFCSRDRTDNRLILHSCRTQNGHHPRKTRRTAAFPQSRCGRWRLGKTVLATEFSMRRIEEREKAPHPKVFRI